MKPSPSIDLTARGGRKFGLQVGAAFLVLSGLLLWRGHTAAFAILAGLGSVLVMGGLAAPMQMLPIYHAWMRMALLISRITTPIFMGIVFYLVLTPIGLLVRGFGRHPLVRTAENGSFWMSREPGSRGDMRRQF